MSFNCSVCIINGCRYCRLQMVVPWLQAKKVACWSHYVTHLKLVAGDKHAIKDFDRELACALEDYSMAAAIEATIPAKCESFQNSKLLYHASCPYGKHIIKNSRMNNLMLACAAD